MNRKSKSLKREDKNDRKWRFYRYFLKMGTTDV